MSEWIITSSILILVIMALRFVLKGKISLRLQYALWAVVLVRLLVPVNIVSSDLSVMNYVDGARELLESDAVEDAEVSFDIATEAWQSGYTWEYNEAYAKLQESEAGWQQRLPDGAELVESSETVPAIETRIGTSEQEVRPLQVGEAGSALDECISLEKIVRFIQSTARYIWFGGMLLLGAWFALVNARFSRKLKNSRFEMGPEYGRAILPVYTSENIDTPCLHGTRNPKIYVTPEILRNEKALKHVLEHETTHYRHGDHIWCMLRMAAIVLHWYNPLVWLAAFISQKDAELACDEGTIKRIGESERIEYGRTLISMVSKNKGRLFVAATSMSGSKNSIKERIILITKKPRTAIYTFIAVVLAMATVIGCTFTSANEKVTKVIINEPDVVIEAEPMAEVKIPGVEGNVTEDKDGTYSWYMKKDVLIFEGTGTIERGDYINEDFSKVLIDEGITGIGPRAFACLDKLDYVYIPDTVTEIGPWAFCYSKNLDNIRFSENCTLFGVNAFEKTAWLEQMIAETPDFDTVRINGIKIADGGKEIIGEVPADPNRVIYGEAGSFYDKHAHQLGIVFKVLNKRTEEFSLGTEIYYLANDGGMNMTLYKTKTGHLEPYVCAGEYYIERLADILYSYKWTELEKPMEAESGYRIVIDSVSDKADRQMTFYEAEGWYVEYKVGDVTTYWLAQGQDNELTVFDYIRRVFDEREADISNVVVNISSAEWGAESLVRQGYANQLYLLTMGNAYKISDYKLIDWGITSKESDTKVTGWFEFAFKPHKSVEEADKEMYTANTRAGEGEYAGMYIKKAIFDVELQSRNGKNNDGWHCTNIEWTE